MHLMATVPKPNHPSLVDVTVTPDSWAPQAGDVYGRPAAGRWERIVVLGVIEAHERPMLHDTNAMVREPCRVTYINGVAGGEILSRTDNDFRATLVSLDMRPCGRMREKTPVKESA